MPSAFRPPPRDGLTALEKLERLESLAKVVADLRASQRAALATSAQVHITEATRLEDMVDRELRSLGYVGSAQTSLPFGGE